MNEFIRYTYMVDNRLIFNADKSGAILYIYDNDKRKNGLDNFIDLLNLKGEKCNKCGSQLQWTFATVSGNFVVFCSNNNCCCNFEYMREYAKYGKTLPMALKKFYEVAGEQE